MLKRRFILVCLLSAIGISVGARALTRAQVISGPATVVPTTQPQQTDAASDARKPQLVAASLDALHNLRHSVLEAKLTPELTVRQFLDRASVTDQLASRLDEAQQRGGTRWRNDQTCEVMLEIPGAKIADAIVKITADHPAELGIPSEAMKRGLAEMRGRTFSATGISTGSQRLDSLRPDNPAGPWRVISDTARKDALKTARSNAVAHVVESLRCISLDAKKTLDDALSDPAFDSDLRTWLAQRPITGVQFDDNLAVTVSLSAGPEELTPAITTVLQQHHLGPPPQDQAAWKLIAQEIARDASPAVGRAIAVPDPAAKPAVGAQAAPAALPRLALHQPPDWVTRQIDAEASANGAGLRTARAAEDAALASLRAEVDRLPLPGNTTVGEAAKRDPRIEKAVARALRCAGTTRVDYGHPGTVKVKVSLLLEMVWREIADAP